ncbi:unnamed protein product [Prunus brigantina]
MASMVSKSNKMNKHICLYALLGLFAGVIFSSCLHGSQMNLEEQLNRAPLTQSFVQLQGTVARRIQDGSITLTVKFLHFFIARFLQFRHLSPVQPPPYSTSMLFWVAFTRSVSSTSDLSL